MERLKEASLPALDITTIIQPIKRYRGWIFWSVVSFFILALIFIGLTPPRYGSVAVMQFDARGNQVLGQTGAVISLSNDESSINSEVDVISSRRLMRDVVKHNDLSIYDTLFEGLDDKEGEALERSLIGRLLGGLNVYRRPRSYTVNIEFASTDAKEASDLANIIATEFIEWQARQLVDVAQSANKWLDQRLKQLKANVEESAQAVQSYREKYGLLELGGQTVSDRQLQDLNEQLTIARTERTKAESQMAQAQIAGENLSSLPGILNSPVIAELRRQETEVLRTKSELSSRYGYKHPKIINIENELRQVREKIDSEIERIRDSFRSAVDIARKNEDDIMRRMTDLEDTLGSKGRAEVKLAELERQLDSNVQIYEAFLQRYKETAEAKQQQQYSAKIISFAQERLKPYWPKPILILFVAVMFGGIIGLSIAYLFYALENGFRNTEQLEEKTRFPQLGIFPEILRETHTREVIKPPSTVTEQIWRAFKSMIALEKPFVGVEHPEYMIMDGYDVIEYPITYPTSYVAESLRSIIARIENQKDDQPKVIMTTSSTAKEGKSLFTVSLARLLALSGKKVILIDCDLRLPSVADLMHAELEHHLEEVLKGEVSLDEAIRRGPKTGCDFLFAKEGNPNSWPLLGSTAMDDLLKELSEDYDYVLLDAPPVLALADTITLAQKVDGVVMMCRWMQTPKGLVKRALNLLTESRINVLGTVLSRVDIHQYERFGFDENSSYYRYHQAYYTERV